MEAEQKDIESLPEFLIPDRIEFPVEPGQLVEFLLVQGSAPGLVDPRIDLFKRIVFPGFDFLVFDSTIVNGSQVAHVEGDGIHLKLLFPKISLIRDHKRSSDIAQIERTSGELLQATDSGTVGTGRTVLILLFETTGELVTVTP